MDGAVSARLLAAVAPNALLIVNLGQVIQRSLGAHALAIAAFGAYPGVNPGLGIKHSEGKVA